MHYGNLLIYCASPSEFQSFPIHLPDFFALIAADTPSSESGKKTGEKWGLILSTKYFFHTSHGYSACRKGLRHGADGFISAPEEVMLWIFTAFKDPSSSAEFEPTNLESKCKYANHYTTEETYLLLPITVKV
jgi:hypothetical protein